MMRADQPTPGEVALAHATITLGGETEKLTALSHAVPIGYWGEPPAVRAFRSDRGPWLQELVTSWEDAKERVSCIEKVIRWAHGTSWPFTCKLCGERETNCYNASVMRRLVSTELCFTCDYWTGALVDLEKSPPKLPRPAIIEGCYYVVKPMSTRPAKYRGFYGMQRKIRWFDGFEAESNDLWNGSTVPERFGASDTAQWIQG